MLLDETCFFLAVDFDKENWRQDVQEFLESCRACNVPAALERSRSGNGGHVWIFFDRGGSSCAGAETRLTLAYGSDGTSAGYRV